MTTRELLRDLQVCGVQLTCVDDRLKVSAPKGVLTPAMRTELARQKAAVMALLAAPPLEEEAQLTSEEPDQAEIVPSSPTEQADRCVQCAAKADTASDQGEPYCHLHRHQPSQVPCEVSPGLARLTSAPFFLQDVAEIWDEVRASPGLVALDLETTGLDARADRVVSIAVGLPGKVSVLDMRPYYDLSPEWQAHWKSALPTLLDVPGITWVGHNLKFDGTFLATHFGVCLEQVYDTMLTEQLLRGIGLHDAGTSVALRETAARYGITVTKEQRAWFPGLHTRPDSWQAPFPAEQLASIVQDVEVVSQVCQRQQAVLQQLGLQDVTRLENEALPALVAIEVHGVFIDTDRWRRILQAKRARQHALERELTKELGRALHASQQSHSMKQQQAYEVYLTDLATEERRLAKVYSADPMVRRRSTCQAYQEHGLRMWKALHPQPAKPKTVGKAINLASSTQLRDALAQLGLPASSTREEALEPFAAMHPVVARLLQWKKLQKVCSAFGENILARIGLDGRLHAEFSQIGATSGRVICHHPNLQQIPKGPAIEEDEENLRRCFVAPPGSRLLKADLSNIELRILAEVSHDETMLRLFAEGKDLHAETAKLMFDLPSETNTKKHLYKGDVSVRDVAKTINFGLAYGMGAQGLANRIDTTLEEAKGLMKTYFATYAGVDRWLRSTAQQALMQGYATTLTGRRRGFVTTITDPALRASMERQAKNHPIQGTNADILKRALTLLYRSLPPGAHLILTVHDEIVVECPQELVTTVEALIKEMMVRACRDYLKIVHIPAPNVVIDTYWKKD